MNCEQYNASLLAAHADNELIGRERRAADDHIARCAACRASLVQERRIKELIRTHAPMTRVPGDVRLRIRAALGELAETDANQRAASRLIDHRVVRRAGQWVAARPARLALSVGSVAAIFLVLLLAGRSTTGNVLAAPAFDAAVRQFDSATRHFVPNAPAAALTNRNGDFAWVMDRDSASGADNDESADLARAYREADVPENIYDFAAAGYGLYGGRIDLSANGDATTSTLYRGEKGSILSICQHAPGMAAPIGARYWVGTHTFYSYKGHSICLTFYPVGHFVSILVANEPVEALLRDVTAADSGPVTF